MSFGNTNAIPAGKKTVVITGIAGRLGQLLAQKLHRLAGYQVIGIDRRIFPACPKDITHYQIDIRSKKARDVFRQNKVDALVHMGIMHTPRASAADHYTWNIKGTAKLLDHCAKYKVPKVVVLSSANAYGPRPDNAQFLTEDAPLLAAQAFPDMRDLVEVDHVASSFFWRSKDIQTVILRPVHILGLVKNAPSNYLRLPTPPVLLGFDPMIQMVHEDDVAEAIVLALQPNCQGIYNITGPGQLPLSAIVSALGKNTIPVPHPVAKPLWRLAFRLGISSFPADQFDFIRYVCMVDGSRARDQLGYVARKDLRATIDAVRGH